MRLPLRCFAALLALVCAGTAVAAAAPNPRRLEAAALAAPVPAGRWVLIVVDANRRGSEAYLAALRRDGYDGRGALVAVVGNAAAAEALQQRRHLLPQAQWTVVDAALLQRQLGLAGVPAALGMDAQQRAAWQVSGQPPRSGSLVLRIADWLAAAP